LQKPLTGLKFKQVKKGDTQNVNIATRDGDSSESRLRKLTLVSFLSFVVLVIVAWTFWAQERTPMASVKTAQQPPAPHEQQPPPPSETEQTPQQLQQLVAPIALYPDRLVAQILAAAAFPEQIVEANRWMQAHSDLTGQAFTQAIDQQPWDSSVKALTALPVVLGNMDKNLSWTSSLGEAYANDPGNVLDAVQAMRHRAKDAGTLKTTPQETVATEDSNIAIAPADADSVYVPQYNPWQAYGSPVDAWPDWSAYPGTWYDGYGCYFGLPYAIAFSNCYPWGWCHWGFDRHHRCVTHNHDRVFPRRAAFNHHDGFQPRNLSGSSSLRSQTSVDSAERGLSARANAERIPSGAGVGQRSLLVPENLAGNFQQRTPSIAAFNGQRGVYNRGTMNPAVGNFRAARGYIAPRRQLVMRPAAFHGYNHVGQVRSVFPRSSGSFANGAAARGSSGSRGVIRR
jgi:hypothetical protein